MLLNFGQGWGVAVVVGVEGESAQVHLHPNLFLYGRTLTGVFFGGVKPKSELPQIVDMCMNKVNFFLILFEASYTLQLCAPK